MYVWLSVYAYQLHAYPHIYREKSIPFLLLPSLTLVGGEDIRVVRHPVDSVHALVGPGEADDAACGVCVQSSKHEIIQGMTTADDAACCIGTFVWMGAYKQA